MQPYFILAMSRDRSPSTLSIAGHGHLDQLIVRARKPLWNDAVVAGEELQAIGYVESPSDIRP